MEPSKIRKDYHSLFSQKYVSDVFLNISVLLITFFAGLCFNKFCMMNNVINFCNVFYVTILLSFINIALLLLTVLSETNNRWYAYLLSFGFGFQHIIFWAYDFETVVYAVTTTAVITLGTMFASTYFNNRDILLYGGALTNSLIALIWMEMLNMYFNNTFISMIHFYGVFVVFIGFLSYDITVIKDRALKFKDDYFDNRIKNKNYDKQVLSDSLNIFLDMISILFELLELFRRKKH